MTKLKSYALNALARLAKQNYPHLLGKDWKSLQDQLKVAADHSLADRKSTLHLSASALYFSNQELCFIHHPYLHQSLLPAGHVEPGEFPGQTAIREFGEETGLQFTPTCRQILVDINQISIPANPVKDEGSHYHIDFRYLLTGHPVEAGPAELAVKFLTYDQAPAEFQVYYPLLAIK
ncbi:NUDIX domain-containing protein [Aerococcus kribbianus]|uniref:NUDIX domain-containing protein n=1 Tax=Aerococcus kribbianus TaxID=2999064 RepID=A0A9X3FNX5_9LACT|nr:MULTISPECIES: NUDIX domain-containing protein [unclassified Aerococcus]MCZ0717931.1 NUDIX domain-containing protein [Aerococcus sp. YH-aer221]MCZ0726218.1 NUDIX domain-containing protein [Aerococcus sp. YH-aer222]